MFCVLQYHRGDNTVLVAGAAQELFRGRFWFQGAYQEKPTTVPSQCQSLSIINFLERAQRFTVKIIDLFFFLSWLCIRCGTPFSASLCFTSTSPVCSSRRLARLRERKSLTSEKPAMYSLYSFSPPQVNYLSNFPHFILLSFPCRYGDMRVMMAYELFSMWQKLGASDSPRTFRFFIKSARTVCPNLCWSV